MHSAQYAYGYEKEGKDAFSISSESKMLFGFGFNDYV